MLMLCVSLNALTGFGAQNITEDVSATTAPAPKRLLETQDFTLPSGTVPDWDLNITGIGLPTTVMLNLSYIVDLVNDSAVDAYEETVVYKGNNQTIIGVDVLDLMQVCADVWYGGAVDVIAEDRYSKEFSAVEILYSIYTHESADVKILLAFAVNGTYLKDSDWADNGALRMVAPSNSRYTYFNSYWVGNVSQLNVTKRWTCDVFVDEVLTHSVPVNTEATYANYNYTTVNLMYHGDMHDFEGPTLESIIEEAGVTLSELSSLKGGAADTNNTIAIAEVPDAILAIAMDDEYFGFNRGPYRLVGANLVPWNWLKNMHALYLYTAEPSPTTNPLPGYLFIGSLLTLVSLTMAVFVYKKRTR
jgi:hypothetical protein